MLTPWLLDGRRAIHFSGSHLVSSASFGTEPVAYQFLNEACGVALVCDAVGEAICPREPQRTRWPAST